MALFYFIFSVSFLVVATWAMLKTINKTKFPPNNDDDGGLYGGLDHPVIDLPPGGTVDDLLTDRWYDDVPTRTFEKVR